METLKANGFNSICKYDGKTYRIQTGAFSIFNNANEYSNKLREKGIANYIKNNIDGTQITI